jgi:hypothetical protein
VSFNNTPLPAGTVRGEFLLVLYESFAATGALFCAAMVKVTVAVLEADPSLTV